MAVQMFQLTGTYHLPDLTPHEGVVEIIPSERVIKDTTGNVILTGRVKVTLDEAGTFTVDLPDPRDATLNPNGFGYTVAAKLRSSHPPAVSFGGDQIADVIVGGVVNVEDVTSVDPSTFEATATYADASTVTALDTRVTTLEESPGGVTSYNELTDTPTLATVATTGAYVDLTGQPVIPDSPADIGAEPAGTVAALDATLAPVAKTGAAGDLTGTDETVSALIADPGTFTAAGLSATYGPLDAVYPEAHGAVGDGVADDTAALVAALTAASAARSTLVLPAGKTYRMSQITLNLDNISIRGLPGSKWVSNLPVSTTTEVLHIIGNDTYIDGLTIEHATPVNIDTDGTTLYANGGNAATIRLGQPGVSIPDMKSNATVINCRVTNSRNTGVFVNSIKGFVRVRNNYVREAGQGICISSCPTNLLVDGNVVERTLDDGIAVLADGQVPDQNQRVVVTGNTVKEGYACGIDLTGVDGGVVANNVTDMTYGPGIIVYKYSGGGPTGPTYRTVVANNHVRNAGKNYGAGKYRTTTGNHSGISAIRTIGCVITGNTILGSEYHGIQTDSNNRLTVVGNVIEDSGQLAINVSTGVAAGANIKLASNLCYNSNGGIAILGNTTYSLTRVDVTGNTVARYKRDGDAGTRRGLQIGHTSRYSVTGNTFDKTEGGDAEYLEAPAGTTSLGRVSGNYGANPVGSITNPAVPASGIPFTNPYPYDCDLYLTGGTITFLGVRRAGGSFVTTGQTAGLIRLPAGADIQINYSAAPTWAWFAN